MLSVTTRTCGCLLNTERRLRVSGLDQSSFPCQEDVGARGFSPEFGPDKGRLHPHRQPALIDPVDRSPWPSGQGFFMG
ncbi:hypothetical protein SEA_FLATHEAD_43 [Mycobacterium phage Flathead]|nr:hypothetical protein SEA_FLATHEAD_43 [Mycobacterium phage Flathead]